MNLKAFKTENAQDIDAHDTDTAPKEPLVIPHPVCYSADAQDIDVHDTDTPPKEPLVIPQPVTLYPRPECEEHSISNKSHDASQATSPGCTVIDSLVADPVTGANSKSNNYLMEDTDCRDAPNHGLDLVEKEAVPVINDCSFDQKYSVNNDGSKTSTDARKRYHSGNLSPTENRSDTEETPESNFESWTTHGAPGTSDGEQKSSQTDVLVTSGPAVTETANSKIQVIETLVSDDIAPVVQKFTTYDAFVKGYNRFNPSSYGSPGLTELPN